VSAQTPCPPSWVSSSPEQTARIAAALARELRLGDLVELEGELGVGKTTFVRAAARELGVTDPVTSPTYTVGARHPAANGAVSHLDLYRSASPWRSWSTSSRTSRTRSSSWSGPRRDAASCPRRAPALSSGTRGAMLG
jgi:ATPase subunit of ABC transporter with duplicated ATPase domains